ncbi:MAG TPA: alanine racemase [Candidatus Binataceae bacterium]|nr:alanine racemase [Candidatus Binataceae bacterium]
MTARSQRPTVIEIDLRALRSNYHVLRKAAGHADMMVVVKADAYGHGAVAITKALVAEGCGHFGVATIVEASELRDAGIRARIYLLGGFFAEQARKVIELDITPFIFDVSLVAPLQAAAKELGRKDFPVHLKIDSGATRLGVLPADLPRAIAELRAAPSLKLEGACTLFANAGDPTSTITNSQLQVFGDALAALATAGMKPAVVHAANSAALVLRPDSHFTLVRPGLAIYGMPPVPAVREKIELTPVMTFKTRVMQIKRVAIGVGVGYGHTFVTRRETILGILPVGYADGYRRGLQHGGEVLIGGKRAPVVGAVSMDLTEIDLTGLPGAAVGDEVVLWGRSGDEIISVNDVARIAQTISYEMLCTVGRRVARVYRDN